MKKTDAPPLATLLGTWFGCGFWPKGPGTAGSLGAFVVLPVWIHEGWSPLWLLALAALMTPAAIWAAGKVSQALGVKDAQIVVIDEVIGQWITLAGASSINWMTAIGALALFRLFDITKPWPVRALERLPGGTGIVADDIMAGVYGALVLFLAGCFNL
ncbi:MAG: phosphatidylglycerophosphatase A [Bryobacterales bacterium]|nr:phosphatidylglycerophosphatase A [Bryobacterales bacterium]